MFEAGEEYKVLPEGEKVGQSVRIDFTEAISIFEESIEGLDSDDDVFGRKTKIFRSSFFFKESPFVPHVCGSGRGQT